MKKISKFLGAFLCTIMVFALFTCIIPNISHAWDVGDVEFYDYTINNNIMESFKVKFQIPYIWGSQATSWLGIQKVPFQNNELTNLGDIYYNFNYDDKAQNTPSDIMNDSNFISQYEIQAFSPNDNDGFDTFGSQVTNIDTEFLNLNIPVDDEDTYYLYLWTKRNDGNIVYPDKLITKLDVGNGNVESKLSVSFDSRYGSAVETQYVTRNGKAVKPADPTRTNYTFGGWYNEYSPFDFDTPITGNMTLVAQWDEAIIANVEGFTGDYDSMEHGINVTVQRPNIYTITYGTTEGIYDLYESPKYTNPGVYTVYYKISANGYEDITGEETVEILANSRENLRAYINNANDYYNSIKDTYQEVAGTLKTAIDSATTVADNENATETEWYNAYRRLRVDVTIARIDTIGTVEYTEPCNTLISAAETEYNALPDDEAKQLVTNYNTLVEARNTYNSLKDVIEKINDAYYAEVQYIEEYKSLVDRAREAYDALTTEQKEFVYNYDLLLEIEEKCEILEKANLLKANTVSFKDNLTLNFLGILDDSVVNKAYVKITYNHYGEETELTIPANPNDKNGNYYRFRFDLTASEMAVVVKADLYLNDIEEPIATWSRSVRQYILSGLQNENQKETEKQLFVSTLSYGGYTQRYFGYNTDSYADEGMYYDFDENSWVEIRKDLSDIIVTSDVDYVRPEGFSDGIRYYGASVFFTYAPHVRYYFELEDGLDIDDYRFVVAGTLYTPKEKDGKYYIDTPTVLAYELDKQQNVIVSGSEETIFGYKCIFDFNYSIITWVKTVVENSPYSNEIDAAKAMFDYYQSAKAFVEGNRNNE